MDARDVLEASVATKEALLADDDELAKVDRVGREMTSALDAGKKVVLFGNGGSAADAQHIAAELAGRFKLDRDGLPAIALTTNTSSITAIANDYDYGVVFSRLVEGMADAGDVVVGISTSGTSENVVEGIRAANALGATTVGLTGKGGGELAGLADVCVMVPSTDTARIQEAHITIGHVVSGQVEDALFG